MYEEDLTAEVEGFIDEDVQEIRVPVARWHTDGRRIKPFVDAFGLRQIEPWVALRDNHDAFGALLLCEVERGTKPRNVLGVAFLVFGIVGIAVCRHARALVGAFLVGIDLVVITAWLINRDEDHVAVGPAPVLGIRGARNALVLQNHLDLAETVRRVEHRASDVVETLDIVEAPIVCPVTVCPFVVAGDVNRGNLDGVEQFGGTGVLVRSAQG